MTPILLAAAAWASTSYPADLADALAMPCTPACTVCHQTLAGGSGTVVHEFGLAMMDRGLTGGANLSALASAVDQMATDGVDSDGDGVIDTDELALGQDPNPGGVAFCDNPMLTPQYGCVASTSGAPASTAGVLAGFVALALARRRNDHGPAA